MLKIKSLAAIVLLLLFLPACSMNHGWPIKKHLNYEEKPMTVRVYTYDTIRELEWSLRKYGSRVTDDIELYGYTVYVYPDPDENMVCEIHVLEIRGESDYNNFNRWGHELAHCLYGPYHHDSVIIDKTK